MTAPHLLWLVLSDDLTTLNRAVGLLRRHNVALAGLNTVPGPEPHMVTLTAVVRCHQPALTRAVNQLRKVVGVRDGATVALSPPAAPAGAESEQPPTSEGVQ
ncbi:MAG: hypothetical protein EXR93_01450 [Gemmatimonadetes bacterium]|nr:hypothetical protein [Gemmatimonadota bacterium]